MPKMQELEEYRVFTGKAEMHKSINGLIGLITGIVSDGTIDELEYLELRNWYGLHKALIDRHPYSEILPAIDAALADQSFDMEDAQDILWLCNQITSDDYYDLITSSLQQLHGIIHGIISNNKILDAELDQLAAWMQKHSFLRSTYPFDEIQSLLQAVTADGIITSEEQNILLSYFSNFVDTRESLTIHEREMSALREKYSIQGICAVEPDIHISGHTICFTGSSTRVKRREIANIVTSHGGTFVDSVTKQLDYLVVGAGGNPCWAYACYGRKIEKAVSLRKEGHHLLLVNEHDFWAALDLDKEATDLCPTN